MLRLVLFGAGKTIIHKNTLCEVVETHDQIRRLLPLVDRDLTESKVKPFWVPRRSVNRKEMRKERIHRQYVSGLRKVFTAPHYTGEPRPDLHSEMTLESRTPSPTSSGPFASLLSGGRFPRPALQMKGFHLVQSVPISDVRRTTQGFFSREEVERAVGKMRTHFGMKAALTEVVFSRQSPTAVAKSYYLNPGVLKVYATRVRQRIRAQKGGFSPTPAE